MKLLKLLEKLNYECVQGTMEVEISSVVYDSREVRSGSLFVCVEGAVYDGHAYAAAAVEKGAVALVISKPVAGVAGKDIAVIRVRDTRYALAFLSAAWFGHPAERLKVIGVTGTKGKTTTTYLVKSILEHAGYKVGLVGTIETIIGEKHLHADNTTPESYLLQEDFARMAEAGIEVVVMEVSSQALKLHRTQGFVFDYGIFTNLEPDHIGANEHENFEEYLACKRLLFQQCRVGIVNGDDTHVGQVVEGHSCELETYGMGEGCMLRADQIRLVHTPSELGVEFHVSESTAFGRMDFDVKVPFPGRFSVYNALCATAVCLHFHVEIPAIQSALQSARVKGRIEKVQISDKFTLLIDYAHNAMALESLLSTLREYQPKRLVCVFGCGGNRSKQRRYEMGEVSGKLADFTVITSDNPRFEDPWAIIEDIKVGIGRTEGAYVEICDRREAIAYVISHAREGDLVVLAGKGHEDYQEIRGKKYPMDERVIIRELLEEGIVPGAESAL